jgi:hypothetical protein
MLGIDGDYTTPLVTADASASGGAFDGGQSAGRGGAMSAGGKTTGGIGGGALDGGAGQAPTGGTDSGGSPAAGGTGGMVTPPDAEPPCESGTKRCLIDRVSACVAPDPSVGCDSTDCARCPEPPPNGFGICDGESCDFACRDGFSKMGSTCEPETTDSGGTGGTGGGSGDECAVSAECAPCGPFRGCCYHGVTVPNRCGCLYVAWCQPFF